MAHPAVQAWRRLNPDRVVPERITPAKFKANKTRSHLTVYRLQGVGPEGEAVIAKRCDRGEGLVERAVYERVLPHVSLPSPHFYGAVEDQDVCWLFIREVQGEKYDVDRPDHRAAAAQWLGLLHTEAPSVAGRAGLPDAGPGRYRDQMRTTRDAVRNHLDNPAFGNGDLAFLDRLLEQFDDLDEHWGRLERDCSGLPPTLIHGDFNGKNLRIQTAPSGPQLVAFDWADAGLAVPAVDLAQVATPSFRMSASPDLATYWSVVRESWPTCDHADIERLANCGAVFRALAVITWDANHLAEAWADAFLPNLQIYQAELVRALDHLGWPIRSEWEGRAPALEGQQR